jgi:hypothetical protein
MRKWMIYLFLPLLLFAQTRTFSPTLRSSLPSPLTASQVDANFAGISNVANTAAKVTFSASQAAMLATSPAPQQGDICWRTDLSAPFYFLGGDPTNIANWSTNGASVTSLFGRTGAVTAQTGDYTVAQVTGALSSASLASTSSGQGAALIGYLAPYTGSVARTESNKNADLWSVADAGIVSDGVTDQTTALVALLGTTLAANRGVILIPYNTKFSINTVYAAVPSGIKLRDESSINFGNNPTYNNKVTAYVTSDTVSDDSWMGVVSGHHASMRMINMGTSGTSSASQRYMSILFAGGIRTDTASKDPIDGFQFLHSIPTGLNAWRTSWVINTRAAVLLGGPWAPLTSYSIGNIRYTTASQAYICTAGGTSSSTPPSGTTYGVTETDGTVTWKYYGPFSNASSMFYFGEDGTAAYRTIGTSSVYFELGAQDLVNSVALKSYRQVIDASALTYALYDVQNVRNVYTDGPVYGFRFERPQSIKWATVSGATPTMSASAGGLYVNNGSATNMTNLLMVGSMTDGDVMLMFANGNTTLVNGSNLQLKGGINVTPTAGQFIRLIKNSGHSSGWIEASRSF